VPDLNLEQLITAAQLLRPLLSELVFVGGSVTGLLITDEAAGDPRPTVDVDAIAEITSYAEYAAFGDRLRVRGFAETRARARRSVAGFIRRRYSMLCRSMRVFSDFQTVGLLLRWKLR
jgi:hypothetical protein